MLYTDTEEQRLVAVYRSDGGYEIHHVGVSWNWQHAGGSRNGADHLRTSMVGLNSQDLVLRHNKAAGFIQFGRLQRDCRCRQGESFGKRRKVAECYRASEIGTFARRR